MPVAKKTTTPARVSDEALKKATGQSWSHWIRFPDSKKGTTLSHKDLVALLNKQVASKWWCQKIALGYEQQKGKRKGWRPGWAI